MWMLSVQITQSCVVSLARMPTKPMVKLVSTELFVRLDLATSYTLKLIACMTARATIEECCRVWLDSGISHAGKGAIVVRAGKDGCYVASRQNTRWIPAYHQNSSKVVDPTGGGNTFLGGLAVGLVRIGDVSEFSTVERAAIWGSVAASFAIEQVGMPTIAGSGTDETWNGDRATRRVDEISRLEDNLAQTEV